MDKLPPKLRAEMMFNTMGRAIILNYESDDKRIKSAVSNYVMLDADFKEGCKFLGLKPSQGKAAISALEDYIDANMIIGGNMPEPEREQLISEMVIRQVKSSWKEFERLSSLGRPSGGNHRKAILGIWKEFPELMDKPASATRKRVKSLLKLDVTDGYIRKIKNGKQD